MLSCIGDTFTMWKRSASDILQCMSLMYNVSYSHSSTDRYNVSIANSYPGNIRGGATNP